MPMNGSNDYEDFDAHTLIEAVELLAEKLAEPGHPLRDADTFESTLSQSKEFLSNIAGWLAQLVYAAPIEEKVSVERQAKRLHEVLQPLWDPGLAPALAPDMLVSMFRRTVEVIREIEQASADYFDPSFEPEQALIILESMAKDVETEAPNEGEELALHRRYAEMMLRCTRAWLLRQQSELAESIPVLLTGVPANELARILRRVAGLLRWFVPN